MGEKLYKVNEDRSLWFDLRTRSSVLLEKIQEVFEGIEVVEDAYRAAAAECREDARNTWFPGYDEWDRNMSENDSLLAQWRGRVEEDVKSFEDLYVKVQFMIILRGGSWVHCDALLDHPTGLLADVFGVSKNHTTLQWEEKVRHSIRTVIVKDKYDVVSVQYSQYEEAGKTADAATEKDKDDQVAAALAAALASVNA